MALLTLMEGDALRITSGADSSLSVLRTSCAALPAGAVHSILLVKSGR
jgi:hypothetical protein